MLWHPLRSSTTPGSHILVAGRSQVLNHAARLGERLQVSAFCDIGYWYAVRVEYPRATEMRGRCKLAGQQGMSGRVPGSFLRPGARSLFAQSGLMKRPKPGPMPGLLNALPLYAVPIPRWAAAAYSPIRLR